MPPCLDRMLLLFLGPAVCAQEGLAAACLRVSIVTALPVELPILFALCYQSSFQPSRVCDLCLHAHGYTDAVISILQIDLGMPP